MKLNDLSTAECALKNIPKSELKTFQNPVQDDYLEGPELYLLGVLYERKGNNSLEIAVDYYRRALAKDATLWCAYEKLVVHKTHLNIEEIFHNESNFRTPDNVTQ